MSTVKEVAVQYATKGAQAARRADQRVQNQVKDTAQTAQQEAGTVNRWMERHRSAVRMIGAATLATMGAIATASPTMRAELSGVRTAFSLFADTVVNDVLPAGGGLMDLAFGLERRYASLSDPTREAASAALLFGGAIGVAVVAVAGIISLIGGLALVVATAAAVLGAVFVVAWRRDWPVIGSLVEYWVGFIMLSLRTLQNFLTADSWSERLTILHGFFKDWGGLIRELFNNLIDDGRTWGRRFVNWLAAGIKSRIGRVRERAGQVRDAITTRVTTAVDNAEQWGRDLIGEFLNGVDSRWDRLQRRLDSIRDRIEDALSFDLARNDRAARRWGQDLMQEMAAGVDSGRPELRASLPSPAPAPAGGGGGTTVVFEKGAIQVGSGGSPRRTGEKTAEEVSQTIQDEFGKRR